RAARQRAAGQDHARPDRLLQLVFRYRPVAVLDQVEQHVERAVLDRHDPAVPPELARAAIDGAAAETVGAAVRVRSGRRFRGIYGIGSDVGRGVDGAVFAAPGRLDLRERGDLAGAHGPRLRALGRHLGG